jgi:hypothetical protein
MHYTSDGSDPTCSSTAYPGGNFSINSAGTFTYKVIACQGGYTQAQQCRVGRGRSTQPAPCR